MLEFMKSSDNVLVIVLLVVLIFVTGVVVHQERTIAIQKQTIRILDKACGDTVLREY